MYRIDVNHFRFLGCEEDGKVCEQSHASYGEQGVTLSWEKPCEIPTRYFVFTRY